MAWEGVHFKVPGGTFSFNCGARYHLLLRLVSIVWFSKLARYAPSPYTGEFWYKALFEGAVHLCCVNNGRANPRFFSLVSLAHQAEVFLAHERFVRVSLCFVCTSPSVVYAIQLLMVVSRPVYLWFWFAWYRTIFSIVYTTTKLVYTMFDQPQALANLRVWRAVCVIALLEPILKPHRSRPHDS